MAWMPPRAPRQAGGEGQLTLRSRSRPVRAGQLGRAGRRGRAADLAPIDSRRSEPRPWAVRRNSGHGTRWHQTAYVSPEPEPHSGPRTPPQRRHKPAYISRRPFGDSCGITPVGGYALVSKAVRTRVMKQGYVVAAIPDLTRDVDVPDQWRRRSADQPLADAARVGDPLREASRRPSRNHRVATFPCLLGVAVLQVGLEESLPAQGKHLVAVLLLKQPDRGRSAIYLARDRLHVCVSRRPPLPGAPRILRCHEEGGGERSDGQLKAIFASPAAPRSPESSTPTWSGASESRPDPPRSHYGRRQSG
jgi:hypothetical protein